MAQVNCPNRSQTYNLPIVLNSGASLTERKETRDRPALGRLTRTMVSNFLPQRIVRQYTQYYKETGFEAFSERTMLRVLNECKASTRKSLQGLDYFAADGARAFDELEGLVLQLGELGRGKEWQVRYVKSLKVAKFYLKGDFKVSNRKCQEFQENWIMFFKQGDLISQMDGSMARKNRSDDRSTLTGKYTSVFALGIRFLSV